jgi:hypothetical protein
VSQQHLKASCVRQRMAKMLSQHYGAPSDTPAPKHKKSLCLLGEELWCAGTYHTSTDAESSLIAAWLTTTVRYICVVCVIITASPGGSSMFAPLTTPQMRRMLTSVLDR